MKRLSRLLLLGPSLLLPEDLVSTSGNDEARRSLEFINGFEFPALRADLGLAIDAGRGWIFYDHPVTFRAPERGYFLLEMGELFLALGAHAKVLPRRNEEGVPDPLLAFPAFFTRVIDLGHDDHHWDGTRRRGAGCVKTGGLISHGRYIYGTSVMPDGRRRATDGAGAVG